MLARGIDADAVSHRYQEFFIGPHWSSFASSGSVNRDPDA